MIVTIYNYANDTVEVEIPAKNADGIEEIYVHILSGDETGFIKCKNGKVIGFDACSFGYGGRIQNYDDGWYLITNHNAIKKWLKFKPTDEKTASYERQRLYD